MKTAVQDKQLAHAVWAIEGNPQQFPESCVAVFPTFGVDDQRSEHSPLHVPLGGRCALGK